MFDEKNIGRKSRETVAFKDMGEMENFLHRLFIFHTIYLNHVPFVLSEVRLVWGGRGGG
jgi:hypothetical protein